MKNKILPLSIIGAAALRWPAVAATSSSDFTTEPDKAMAAAHESFLKGTCRRPPHPSTRLQQCEERVEKVAGSAKEGVKKAETNWISSGKALRAAQ
jgi:hypothetical protein